MGMDVTDLSSNIIISWVGASLGHQPSLWSHHWGLKRGKKIAFKFISKNRVERLGPINARVAARPCVVLIPSVDVPLKIWFSGNNFQKEFTCRWDRTKSALGTHHISAPEQFIGEFFVKSKPVDFPGSSSHSNGMVRSQCPAGSGSCPLTENVFHSGCSEWGKLTCFWHPHNVSLPHIRQCHVLGWMNGAHCCSTGPRNRLGCFLATIGTNTFPWKWKIKILHDHQEWLTVCHCTGQPSAIAERFQMSLFPGTCFTQSRLPQLVHGWAQSTEIINYIKNLI